MHSLAFESLSKSQKSMLSIAIELAKTSTARMRHGAIVVRHGNIVGMGVNVPRTNPDHAADKHIEAGILSLHAERAALRRAGEASTRSTLYIARVDKAGRPVYSAPCSKCLDTIRESGVKRIVFT